MSALIALIQHSARHSGQSKKAKKRKEKKKKKEEKKITQIIKEKTQLFLFTDMIVYIEDTKKH